MINIQKQIDYWINGAVDDLESAKVLVERKRLLHGLFFCHLVIEKALKAHVVKITKGLLRNKFSELGEVILFDNKVKNAGIAKLRRGFLTKLAGKRMSINGVVVS